MRTDYGRKLIKSMESLNELNNEARIGTANKRRR